MTDPSIEHLWAALWSPSPPSEDFRLRFELSGEEFDNTVQQVPRFLQGHSRASAVANALFTGACIGVVAWNGRTPYPVGLPDDVKDGFVALQSTGFAAPQIAEWSTCLYPDPAGNEAEVWTLRGYDLGHDKVARDTLLWHAVASEMPIYPHAPVIIFLIDPDIPAMLHVYDDRGMDVIVEDPTKLTGLYADFADWLLDYDRNRMAALF
ncbi:DUF3885 domain-containing protein [Sphingomonas sp. GB1N7]|uniref:DUF3885 domain-containing protein n=1 Tax=Parasphingomonas caseinilytica TaxID=3096158 RepID=UPI002FCA7256